MVYLFWIAFSLLAWSYLLYPFFLKGLSNFYRPTLGVKEGIKTICIIIPSYNEEKVIQGKIENLRDSLSGYSKDIGIKIVSDGSTDNTVSIAKESINNDPRFELIELPRLGKSQALNHVIGLIKSDVIILSDANVIFKKGIIQELCSALEPSNVGAVGAKVSYMNPNNLNSGEGESLYWKYEERIKSLESQIGHMSGLAGACYAFKRNYFKALQKGCINDDFTMSMNIQLQDHYVVINPKAIVYEEVARSKGSEFQRHVRDSVGHFEVLFNFLKQPKLYKKPLVLFIFLSHRVFRWLGPFLLLCLFVGSLTLGLNHNYLPNYYLWIFTIQMMFYACSAVLWLFPFEKIRIPKVILFPIYFINLNTALFIGFFKYLLKKDYSKWNSTAR